MIKLKELRNENNLSQGTMAEILQVTRQAYSRYELGERELGYNALIKLSKYFDVSVDYLLGNSTYYYPDQVTPTAPQLSAEEREIITMYASLPPAGKKLVRQTLETLTDTTSSAGSGQMHKKA